MSPPPPPRPPHHASPPASTAAPSTAAQEGPGVRIPRVKPPTPRPPLIECDGSNARLEMMSHTINQLAAPFTEAPPPHQGALGQVTQTVGGVLGLLNAPLDLANTGLAMVTAPLNAVMPAMPAAVIGLALHMGVPHTHTHPPSLIPPAPPIPLPSIGNIMMAGAINVLINGVPAARVGDVGIVITCGSLGPPSEIILGSSSVLIGGSRAARVMDITRHDNPVDPNAMAGPMSTLGKVMSTMGQVMAKAGPIVGLASAGMSVVDAAHSAGESSAAQSAAEAEAAAAEAVGHALNAAMQAAQIAADAAAGALSAMVGKDPGLAPGTGMLMIGSPNVLIGGFPCPDLMSSAVGLLKKVQFRNRRLQGILDGLLGRGCRSCS